MSEYGYRSTQRLIIGLIVITVGVVFTLDNLGLMNAQDVLRWWPALLVGYGLMRLTGFGTRQSTWFGGILSAAGIWMLLYNAGYVSRDVWDFWPVLLIVWGIAMIRRRSTFFRVGVFPRGQGAVIGGMVGEASERLGDRAERLRQRAERMRERAERKGERLNLYAERMREYAERLTADAQGGAGSPAPVTSSGTDGANTFNVNVLMSNVARKITSQEFKGGSVEALLGGADVDLRAARLADGKAHIEVHLVMGGLNLFVPEDWTVEFHGTPVMGSVEDQTRRPAAEPQGRLVLDGVVVMSSVYIKN
jgi:hypothetical protein